MLNQKKFMKRTFLLFVIFAIFAYGIIFSLGSSSCCNENHQKTITEESTTVIQSKSDTTEKTSEQKKEQTTVPEETTRSENYTHGLVYDIVQSKKSTYLRCSGLYATETPKKIIVPSEITVSIPSDYVPNEEYYINHKTENFIITKDVSLVPGETYTLKVTQIGIMAFSSNNTTEEIVLPDTITMIDLFAFNDCSNLKKINIPKNLKSVESHAFEGCKSLNEILYKGSPENLSKIKIEKDDNATFLDLVKKIINEAKTTAQSQETTVKNKMETTRKENK